jgi:hypothetical protein
MRISSAYDIPTTVCGGGCNKDWPGVLNNCHNANHHQMGIQNCTAKLKQQGNNGRSSTQGQPKTIHYIQPHDDVFKFRKLYIPIFLIYIFLNDRVTKYCFIRTSNPFT